ncbi:hypothetical protein [Candidatus Nitrosocosmicus arcticus]|uniref:Uncharacterized protein n=1 Tax=Candidatus Nitrosocosmicus arcticus TaxID=2035267 RepID=A0A557SY12_9ARCH|nr:hypothetical protein [Candidatus Nitrosocosmicus arcticus]TVP41482.1 hypothetical protein NARC_30197 [Candidatus Nitrosocosmicus arcticus]
MKTLQIATFSDDDQDGIALGIQNFPIHQLILLCYSSDEAKAIEYSKKIETIIGIGSEIILVEKENVVKDTVERVSEVVLRKSMEYQHILMNVSSGDKLINCAALSSAFINGTKAFTMDHDHRMLLLWPVLNFSYSEIVSGTKINILKSIDSIGGMVSSLEELEQISGYGKPLLSYHVQGGKDNKGLADLGLVEVDKGNRGKTVINITMLGKLMVGSNSIVNPD